MGHEPCNLLATTTTTTTTYSPANKLKEGVQFSLGKDSFLDKQLLQEEMEEEEEDGGRV